MRKEIENEFLQVKSLEEFKNLVMKYKIKSIKDLSSQIAKHWNNLLMDTTSVEQHNDPRKQIK